MKHQCHPYVLVLALCFMAALPACTWERTHVNPGLRHMDTSSIVVGKTTWREVLREYGPPPITSVQEAPVRHVSPRHLKYAFSDGKSFTFTIPYLIVIGFEWADRHLVEELLVEFDEAGVVSGIYRSYSDTIWPPFEGEGSRQPQSTEDLTEEHRE